MKENTALAKKMGIAAWIITVAVLMLVGLMRRVKIDVGIDFSFLPPLHATFNMFVAIALVFALYFIKLKNIQAHVLLISHIILAAVSLPFILFTFIRGFTYQVEKHKKLARWVWPIWFYVAFSGPISFFMLRPFYS